jgi:hypothetical protein
MHKPCHFGAVVSWSDLTSHPHFFDRRESWGGLDMNDEDKCEERSRDAIASGGKYKLVAPLKQAGWSQEA